MKGIVFISSVQNPEENISIGERGLNFCADTCIPNDFDMIAAEAAIRLKEAGLLDEIIVFGISPVKDHLMKALAMGADRAIYAHADCSALTPETVVATALQAIAPTQDTIWFLGKLGVGFESHATAQILAAKLNIPCIASAFDIQYRGDLWHIRTESDEGTPTFVQRPPFAVTADLRLAEPRFPGLPSIIRARKKPFDEIPIAAASETITLSIAASPDTRRQCRFVDTSSFIAAIAEVKL